MNASRHFKLLGVVSVLVAFFVPGISAHADSSPAKLTPPMNYLLNCQGCHMADGSGRPGYIPSFRDSVARFLALPAGRAYLGRVPGISQSLLDDRDRAAVLNWIVSAFDSQHVPADFSPYTEEEFARYRRDPVSQAGNERTRLLAMLANGEGSVSPQSSGTATVSAEAPPRVADTGPPQQFAICAACHSISPDGASAMGPNLRGVLGRRAGTLAGFGYSSAMRTSNIVWTRSELDAFLANVTAKVPGTMMPFGGVSDPTDRAAIIDYLQQLR